MDEVDSAEFSEWMAFDQLDPIGAEREDLRMGILASTVVRCQNPKADVRPLDFMPDFEGNRKGKKRGQSVEEMQARMMLASGVKRKGKTNG